MTPMTGSLTKLAHKHHRGLGRETYFKADVIQDESACMYMPHHAKYSKGAFLFLSFKGIVLCSTMSSTLVLEITRPGASPTEGQCSFILLSTP